MLNSTLVSFLVLGAIGWIIYKIFIWPFYVSPLRKIPGPPSKSPIVGNLKSLMAGFETDSNVDDPQLEWVKKYGKLVKYHGLFNKPTLFVADPKILQEMTISKSYDYVKPHSAAAIALIGKGLVFTEGDDHKRQRKMMNPVFTYSSIKEMVPTFIRVANTFKGLVENDVKLGKPIINITPYISQTTLDIIGLVGFSYEFNSLTSKNELAEAYDSIFNSPPTPTKSAITMLGNYISWLRKLPIEMNRKADEANAVITRVSTKLVEEKYKKAEKGELKEKDLLSLLININKTLPIEEKMTDEELRDQIMTFLLAGHETTSVLTSWALYFLSIHPREQDLLREELVKAFPDKSNFNPTFDEIHALEYLNCVIKETLRLNAPVPFVRRTNLKDQVWGGYHIPKNTEMFIGIGALHKSTEIWGPTAEEFIPGRWLDPALTKNVSNINFMPFLNGARGCIGNKLALAEAKIMLGMLVRNFVFKPVEGFNVRRRVYPTPKIDPYLGLSVSIVES